MGGDGKDSPSSNKRIAKSSATTKLLAFLSFNGLGLISFVVSITMLVGLFTHPHVVGLYMVLPYYTYTLVLRRDELKDGCHWTRFSRDFPMFRVMRSYLNLTIDKPKELLEADKKPASQFILAVLPHGTNADYRIVMDGILAEALPNNACNVRTLAASVLFRIPLLREIALWTGCVDARRSVAEGVLDRGHSFLVLPGGMAEQIRTTHGKEIVYLKSRKGFVKLAMRKGVPVVPMYAFGASDMYKTSHAFFETRLWLVQNIGACIVLVSGLLNSFLCPLPVKTTLVFGKPIHFKCKNKDSPTAEEVDAAHAEFMEALTTLFDEHKQRLGYGDRTLEIC